MRTIIAFCGVKQSGKTTAFNVVREHFNATELTLAKKIKDVCAEVFGFEREKLEVQAYKEKKLDPPVFLTEESLVTIVKRYDIEYEFDRHIRPHIGKICLTPREVLQYVGTEVLKGIDADIHCKTAVKDIPDDGLFVVTDLRFPDEHTFFLKFDCDFRPFYIHNINAEQVALQDKHQSEQMVMETAKRCTAVMNLASLSDFQKQIKTLVEGIVCHTSKM